MKLIYRASDINEANIVCGLLRSNGIEAHVGGYYLQGGVGDLAAFDFATVHVADEDVARARTIIADYENTPGNGNGNIKQNANDRFPGKAILLALLLAAMIYYLVFH